MTKILATDHSFYFRLERPKILNSLQTKHLISGINRKLKNESDITSINKNISDNDDKIENIKEYVKTTNLSIKLTL